MIRLNPFKLFMAVALIALNACDGGKTSIAVEETEVKGMIDNPSKKLIPIRLLISSQSRWHLVIEFPEPKNIKLVRNGCIPNSINFATPLISPKEAPPPTKGKISPFIT